MNRNFFISMFACVMVANMYAGMENIMCNEIHVYLGDIEYQAGKRAREQHGWRAWFGYRGIDEKCVADVKQALGKVMSIIRSAGYCENYPEFKRR